ncbi:hypothetical protein JCM11491_001160 [Sporobolomyces phaffii]
MQGIAILLFLGLATLLVLVSRRKSNSSVPPTFSVPYLPSFLAGIVALSDMAQVAIDNGLGTWEGAKMLVADAWALQANAPYVASQVLLYLVQAPSTCIEGVQREVDRSPSTTSQSCITETLRLGTSVFSIRDVEQPLVLSSRERGQVVVPPNSRIICATRASHLDESQWGSSALEWDGRRFYDEELSETDRDSTGERDSEPKSSLSRRVWGFGGGISRCEGNMLATLELKAIVSIILSKLELKLVGPTSADPEHYESVKFKGAKDGFRPKRRPGRVGLGVLQFDKDVKVRVRRRTLSRS